jgi:hypothetical protein
VLIRALSAVLWFVGAMYACDFIVFATNGPYVLGPIVGVASALFAVVDPLHRVWPASPDQAHTVSATPGADAFLPQSRAS